MWFWALICSGFLNSPTVCVSLFVEFPLGAHVIFILDLVSDLGELLSLEKRQKIPSFIKRIKDSSVFIIALVYKLFLKSVMELKIKLIFISKSFLTDDSLHGLGIFTLGVNSVHLVGNIWVIHSCHASTNSTLHQSWERWQHIDWRIDTSLMHVSVDVDLSFCNISC